MAINQKLSRSRGFTIVELLIVVVVIAILAAITIVSYNGISNRAKESAAQAAASQAGKKVMTHATTNADQYPGTLGNAGVTNSGGTTYEYSVNNVANPKSFCVTATVSNISYHASSTNSSPASGLCPGHAGIAVADGSLMQTITAANCPTSRTRAVDARDNHTYWVQQLGDGKCWMLTNLGYAGGGTNTYGDTRTLTNGTGGSATYTVASYYVVPSTTNFTTEPTNPSTATNGTGQYGYLYNWCAAMGGQATAACANATTPTPVTTTSICPAGWRLPVGNGGEFTALNNAVNGGLTNTDAGLLTTPWLAQRSGDWYSGFYDQGSSGGYWSSSQYSATSAYSLYFSSSTVDLANGSDKGVGFAVRCVAS